MHNFECLRLVRNPLDHARLNEELNMYMNLLWLPLKCCLEVKSEYLKQTGKMPL